MNEVDAPLRKPSSFLIRVEMAQQVAEKFDGRERDYPSKTPHQAVSWRSSKRSPMRRAVAKE